MSIDYAVWSSQQVIIQTNGKVCGSTRELLNSVFFKELVQKFLRDLKKKESPLLEIFEESFDFKEESFINLLKMLGEMPLQRAVGIVPSTASFARDPKLLHRFVEELYNYWRRFNRFLICFSIGDTHDCHPYTTFNNTIESLTHLSRAAYRDICENISGEHPRVYRQVAAGAQVGLIAVAKEWPCPKEYDYQSLKNIPFIRQVLLHPPLMIDPPMNKRDGQFKQVMENPLKGLEFNTDEWLCYPAQVGPLVVFIYFNYKFIELGCSLANLFELATDEQIKRGPDALYTFGASFESLQRFGTLPTVFYEDNANGLLVGAVPGDDQFGYFGYLKKMTLTLHNIVMMNKYHRLPFHGAMVRVILKNNKTANLIIIGDTGAGKSESLEAFRVIGADYIRELQIIADDMGSLEICPDGLIKGYGTEIGAFVRLDDLQPGYVFEQIDRAIIMSPHKVNARAVVPVTNLDEVLHGYPVNYLLYANNYEEVDSDCPIIEQFKGLQEALQVFRKGAAMAKGTTTATGLVHSYFANIFGAPQYRDLHEKIAVETFETAFAGGVFVGQIRTRLGIPGYELKGPQLAAKALFDLIELQD